VHRFRTVLFSRHVDAVATFRNHKQSEASEDGKANSNFPHKFSPINIVVQVERTFLNGVRSTLIFSIEVDEGPRGLNDFWYPR
jgi:hypothetical protein